MVGLGRDYPLQIAWRKPNGQRGTICSTDGTTRHGYSRERPNRQHGVLLLHDSARHHIANMTKEAIKTCGREVLPHPPYSPDWTTTYFHLFQMLCAEFCLILMQNWEVGWMNFCSQNRVNSTNDVLKTCWMLGWSCKQQWRMHYWLISFLYFIKPLNKITWKKAQT